MSTSTTTTSPEQARENPYPLLEPGTNSESGTAGGLLSALIEIAGAEGGSLYGVLAAWQREQDRLANRGWRRPGGMIRPAGL
ncbi:MAG TPA: hypothetical protein VF040_09245 [Ktedonobacterales bacterium]